eukprot:3118534-Pyramimonas_sp.AAC.1
METRLARSKSVRHAQETGGTDVGAMTGRANFVSSGTIGSQSDASTGPTGRPLVILGPGPCDARACPWSGQ